MIPTSDILAAVQAGQNLTQAFSRDEFAPVLAHPEGTKVTLLTPLKLEAPRFLTAAPIFHEVMAFIAYVNEFKDECSRIFYTQDGAFVAVLDYHLTKEDLIIRQQRHGDHTAKLVLKRSPEWLAWDGASEKAMGQQAFAEFIEDNTRDILVPDPETMLRVASGLHATVGATFKQATNQANGQIQLAFNEEINGTVNGTTEQIPTQFQIGLRPFMGCDRYPVDCRLRYRIDRSNGAALKLHYKALHLDQITEAAIEAVAAQVGSGTGIVAALGAHDPDAFKRGQ